VYDGHPDFRGNSLCVILGLRRFARGDLAIADTGSSDEVAVSDG
jgi:hypothetical protein